MIRWPDEIPARLDEVVPCAPGELHAWSTALSEVVARPDLLSDEERERAAGMIPRVRTRFERSRTLLRRLVGRYTDTEPQALRFERIGEGKPVLAPGEPRLAFNLSHAEDRWVCAVAAGGRVGADLEHADRGVDVTGVASRIFAPAEVESILAGPDAAVRRRRFFRTWTAREALVKVTAAGMFTLDVPFHIEAPDDAPLRLRGPEADTWTLVEIPLGADWVGAVACDFAASSLRAHRLIA